MTEELESQNENEDEVIQDKNSESELSQDVKSANKSSKLILYGFIGLTSILILTLAVLATLLLTRGNNAPQVGQTTNKPNAVAIKQEVKKEESMEENKEEHKEDKKEEGGHGSKEEGQQAAGSVPEFFQIRPSIVVTFPASGRTRYVSLDIDLMTHTKASIKTLEAYAPLIKSNLVDLLSKQSFDEIVTEEGKKNLRKQALTLLQTVMNEQAGDPLVEQVLFTSFIVQ